MLLKCHAFACHAILLRHVQTLECHPSLHSPISSLKKREKIGYYTMARWE